MPPLPSLWSERHQPLPPPKLVLWLEATWLLIILPIQKSTMFATHTHYPSSSMLCVKTWTPNRHHAALNCSPSWSTRCALQAPRLSKQLTTIFWWRKTAKKAKRSSRLISPMQLKKKFKWIQRLTKTCWIYRMLFLDALPQAGSTASIELMSELLQVKKFSSSIGQVQRFLTSDKYWIDRMIKSRVVKLSAGTFHYPFQNTQPSMSSNPSW